MAFYPGPNYALDDEFLRARLQKIMIDNGLDCVVETGLNDGQSTLEFARMAPQVIGIDIDQECVDCTLDRLAKARVFNWKLYVGNSPDVLRDIMPMLVPEKTLFFLDAHWGHGDCPILEEIKAIPRGKGVLVFHDFQVPGSSFGWDHVYVSRAYHVLGYDFLKPELDAWSPTHRIEYPTQVSGSARGSAYVFPR